ncbi:MAG: divalent-cation tolerance protein CutA [Candidatus Aenigmarchaeota archaeon]|nr:divalent-cation tolerance protein CutA [Candidatus Aenigmarchaeota archaeon]
MGTKFVSVYITSAGMEEAEKIQKALVEERLAACVNIIPEIRSCYWWKDRIENSVEVGIVAKTRLSLMGKLIKRVKQIHSYTAPCIVAWPIIAGNSDFLKWIEKETKG